MPRTVVLHMKSLKNQFLSLLAQNVQQIFDINHQPH